MSGLETDAEMVRELIAFTKQPAAQVAKKAKVDPKTIRRHETGIAKFRLSQTTIEKLQRAYPDFPGWAQYAASAINALADDLRRETNTASKYASVKEKQEAQANLSGMVSVSRINLDFGLGPAFMDSEVVEAQAEKLLFPLDWLRAITTSSPDQLYWARAKGDSMRPEIDEGDVILIDRSAVGSSFSDLYWAIAYGQSGMVKRLRPMPDGSVKILSNNPGVPAEIAYDGELHVFGRVVAVVRRI